MAAIMDFLGKPYSSPATEKAMAEYRKAKELAAEAKRKEAEEMQKIEAYFDDNSPDNCGVSCPEASENYPSCWRCCPHAKKYLEGSGNE